MLSEKEDHAPSPPQLRPSVSTESLGNSSSRSRQRGPAHRHEPALYRLEAVFDGRNVRNEFTRGQDTEHDDSDHKCIVMRNREILLIGRLTREWLERQQPDHDIAASEICEWQFSDLTVSSLHLRVYSVQYDDTGDIEPLIYAEDLSSNGCYLNDVYMGRGRPAVLLSDGDCLKLSETIGLKVKCLPNPDRASVFSRDQLREIETFKSSYHLSTKQLGSGGQGQVLLAVKVTSKQQVACKVVDLAKITAAKVESRRVKRLQGNTVPNSSWNAQKETRSITSAIARTYDEIDILKDLRHPNIVAIEKVFHAEGAVYIMQELLTGGDLHTYFTFHDGVFDESTTGHILKQILEAVKYLHDHDIVHRDIKMENVLVAARDALVRVVLADFGAARRLMPRSNSPLRRMTSLAGTYGYMAPEIWDETRLKQKIPYTKGVDIWSIGCMAFLMITGEYAFECSPGSDSADDMNAEIQNYKLNHKTIWDRARRQGYGVNARIKDLVKRCLVVDEEQRMTAKEALTHEFFTNGNAEEYFKRCYQRSIRHWRPRPQLPNLVEEIVIPRGVRHRGKLNFSSPRKSSQSPPSSRSASPRPQPRTHTLRHIYRAESPTKQQPASRSSNTPTKTGNRRPPGPSRAVQGLQGARGAVSSRTVIDLSILDGVSSDKFDEETSITMTAGNGEREVQKPPSQSLRRTSLRRPSRKMSAMTQPKPAIPPDDKMIFEMEDMPEVPVNAPGRAGSQDYRPSPSPSPVQVILDSANDMSDVVDGMYSGAEAL